MTDLEDIRRDGEEAIIALMKSLDERHRALLRDSLLRYGSVQNIPPAVWQQIQGETENELAAIYLLLIGNAFGYTTAELGGQGVRTPRTNPLGLAHRSLGAAAQARSTAAASVAGIQRELNRSLQQARLDVTKGSVGELTQQGLDDALAEILDEARRKQIAVTETTEAITAGQREASGAAGGRNTAGQRVRVEMRWQTERDNRVCPRCSPLHETPEEVWSLVFPDGPGRDAHPNCRCYLRAVVVVESDTEDA